jgi:hypothetical protein
VQRAPGARVGGDVVDVDVPGVSSVTARARRTDWGMVSAISGIAAFLGLVAISLLIIAVMPKAIDRICEALETRTLYVVMWGVVGLLAIVPVALVLLLTVVGILLIPLEILLVAAIWLVGYVAVSRTAGKKLLALFGSHGKPAALEVFLGLVILALASMVPFFGWLVGIAVLVLGLGSVITALLDRRVRAETQP